ncbi:MAG: sugar ABC transporter ATP-binding protein [Treponema sp.]|jgi:ribose transport system ATP-binding protein|nr:sugar ABC transporter ATP-binding protein [Treponema sp.]
MDGQPILEMKGISKYFPGVTALDKVDLDVLPGEIHVLVGENGAGKSTLIKIISGLYRKDEGSYFFNGREINLLSPNHARTLGISTVYQELTLAPDLSAAENIYMGNLARDKLGLVDWKRVYKNAQELLESLDIDIDSHIRVSKLSVGFRQMVEISRALSLNSKVLILDEPTAVLTDKESQILFKHIRNIQEKKVGIIYISHRIAEILDLADRITVLRDGRKIDTVNAGSVNYDSIVRMMVGRDVNSGYTGRKTGEKNFMEIRNFSSADKKVKSVSFGIKKGEILGIYGLVGSGRTELARLMFALDKKSSGTFLINDKEVTIKSPIDAKANGMGYLPEDRRLEGLVLDMDVGKNICLASHREISKNGLLSAQKEKAMAEHGVKSISIKTTGLRQKIMNLSGGNQQKAIMARWLARFPALQFLIMDEPTRGVDVGAKSEIHNLIRGQAEQGLTVMMISSDMPEVLSVSDRIIVMREGEISAEFTNSEASEEKIIFAAAR